MDSNEWPACMSSREGWLIPTSDFGSKGTSVHNRTRVCINPNCEFNLKFRNSDIHLDASIIRGGRVR